MLDLKAQLGSNFFEIISILSVGIPLLATTTRSQIFWLYTYVSVSEAEPSCQIHRELPFLENHVQTPNVSDLRFILHTRNGMSFWGSTGISKSYPKHRTSRT